MSTWALQRPVPYTGVVLDIEGTTTPVSFVYDVLFPYARSRLGAFVTGADDARLDAALCMLREEWRRDRAIDVTVPVWENEGDRSGAAPYLLWLMDRDRKSPGLKSVQGLIWQQGYEDGALRGEVFPDVPPAFERWKRGGVTVAIYSSGSVLAQRLLFSHTTAGDLTPYIADYFDTAVGAKQSAESYRRIAGRLRGGAEPAQLLFVSDTPAEIEAAAGAGFQTLLCVRGGDSSVPSPPARVIRTFAEIDEARN